MMATLDAPWKTRGALNGGLDALKGWWGVEGGSGVSNSLSTFAMLGCTSNYFRSDLEQSESFMSKRRSRTKCSIPVHGLKY